MTKQPIQTIPLSFTEYTTKTKLPSKYYFLDAMGNYIFILTNKRERALEYLVNEYGKLYTLRTIGGSKGNGTSCTESCSTRRGQSKFRDNFGLPRGIV